MKKRVILIIGLLSAIVSISGVALAATYLFRDSLPIVVLGKEYNYKDLKSGVLKDLKKNNPVFDMDELNKFVTYNVDTESLSKTNLLTRLDYALTAKDNSLVYGVDFDKDGLRDYLTEYNTTATEPVDASIVKADTYSLVPEKLGTKIDTDALLDSLNSNTTSVKIEDYLAKPAITKETLNPKFSEIENFANWSCKYSNGSELKSCADYVNYNSETGEVTTDSFWISKAIKDIMKCSTNYLIY